MEDSGLVRKRPMSGAEQENERDDGATGKRSRLEFSSSIEDAPENLIPDFLLPGERGNHFLKHHLQLLKALYSPDIDEQQQEEDGVMTDDHFQTIKTFLQERKRLRSVTNKVKVYQGVEEEASKFIQEETKASLVSLTPDFTTSVVKQEQSPYPQSRFFSGSHRNDQVDPNHGTLVLMSVFLKRKSLIADQALKQQTSPFKALVSDVRRRVDSIQTLLAKQNDTSASQDESLASPIADGLHSCESEDQAETLGRLKTKLNLWKLLRSDLESIA